MILPNEDSSKFMFMEVEYELIPIYDMNVSEAIDRIPLCVSMKGGE